MSPASGVPVNEVITPLILAGIGLYALFCMNQKQRLEIELAAITSRFSDKEREVSAKEAQLLTLVRQSEDLNKRLLRLDQTNQRLRNRLDEMEADAQETDIEVIQPLTSVCEEMQKRLIALQRENAGLGCQLEEAKALAHSKGLEVDGLLAREEETHEHNLEQMAFQAAQTEEIAELEATLRATEAECRLKSARVDHLTKTQDRLLTTEREKWQREVLELKDKLSECYRRLTSAQSDPGALNGFPAHPCDSPDLGGLPSYRSPPAYSGPGRMET